MSLPLPWWRDFSMMLVKMKSPLLKKKKLKKEKKKNQNGSVFKQMEIR